MKIFTSLLQNIGCEVVKHCFIVNKRTNVAVFCTNVATKMHQSCR